MIDFTFVQGMPLLSKGSKCRNLTHDSHHPRSNSYDLCENICPFVFFSTKYQLKEEKLIMDDYVLQLIQNLT